MTEVAQEERIWGVVEPYLAAEQLELDDLELTGRGGGRTLRITVDGENVTVDRLADLSRGLSRLLDHSSDLEDEYQLEVSSPGLERKLKRPGHYLKSLGREAVAKVQRGETRETLRGTISAADHSSFTLDTDAGPEVIGYSDVIATKTVFRWEKAPKPGH